MTELKTWKFESDDERREFREWKRNELAAFLHTHLGRYGDPIEHIRACLDFASSRCSGRGGTVTTLSQDGALAGVAVTNNTNMGTYVPENLLVYIAIDGVHRGQGLGTVLLRRVVESVEGDIALHVEPDNPARRLYERAGFTQPYLEMRLHR